MGDLTKLVEEVFLLTATYPRTIWNLLFSPGVLFDTTNSAKVCPPSATYLFTVAIMYFWFRAIHYRASASIPDWLEKALLPLAAAYVAIVANFQQLAIGLTGKTSHIEFSMQLGALVYAICPPLLASLLVFELERRYFKESSFTFAPIWALYCLTLYNICRAAYGLSPKFAVLGAFYGVAAFFVFVICLMTIFGAFSSGSRKENG